VTNSNLDIVTVLRNKRKSKGYTAKELADLADIVEGTYRSYEYGRNKPDIASIEKIAVALECNVFDLIDQKHSMYATGEYKGAARYKLRSEPISIRSDNNLVFCTKLGASWFATDIGRRFREISKKAGISGISIHSLRHTFATRGLEQGIPLKVMQELLGHTSIKMTADLYTHVLPGTKHNEMMKLSDAIQF